MIREIALAVVGLASLGLAGVSLFMLIAPRRALDVLAAMGSTPLIHFGEMAVRALVGGALIIAGPESALGNVLTLIGWFLLGSATILALLPRRWHSAYSRWWAARMPVWAFRLSGVVGAAAGLVLPIAFL